MKPRQDDEFVDRLRGQVERCSHPAGGGFWKGLSLVGSVGWLVVLPALAGLVVGRLLDSHFHSGIFWTLPLLLLGLAAGCAMAWRQVKDVIS